MSLAVFKEMIEVNRKHAIAVYQGDFSGRHPTEWQFDKEGTMFFSFLLGKGNIVTYAALLENKEVGKETVSVVIYSSDSLTRAFQSASVNVCKLVWYKGLTELIHTNFHDRLVNFIKKAIELEESPNDWNIWERSKTDVVIYSAALSKSYRLQLTEKEGYIRLPGFISMDAHDEVE